MSVLCELTNTELGLVAGGDAGFMIVLDDAGTTTFSGYLALANPLRLR